jgi:hypothetical protein
MHAAQMALEFRQRERALRRLPLPYSLASRLRDAGIAANGHEWAGESALLKVHRAAVRWPTSEER